MRKQNLLFLLVIIYLAGCTAVDNENESNDHTDHGHSIAVTQWEHDLELFMEYSMLTVSEPEQFIIHLTDMETFHPVTGGTVSVLVHQSGGEVQTFTRETPTSPGIFTPGVMLGQVGEYEGTVRYDLNGQIKDFAIGTIVVYNDEDDMPHEEDEEHDTISFLKEQQWPAEFRTEVVRQKDIYASVAAVAEVIPHQHGYAEIVSPVEAILEVAHNQNMAGPGMRVRKGDILATLSPPLSATNTWIERRMAYEKAHSEFERAKRMFEKDAISERDYEDLRREYLIQKAGYEAFTAVDSFANHLQIKSPIDGVIADVSILPGATAQPGQKLMTIINPVIIWLKIYLFEKDYYRLGEIKGVVVHIPGITTPVFLDKQDISLLSRGELVLPENRTIPIILEAKNADRLFKVGQVLQAELYTGSQETYLAVPDGAVIEDDFQKVVYVQSGAETFERIPVTTGPSYRGWTAIISGLAEGERVVSVGGYLVKLASMNKDIGHGHAH